MSARTGRKPIEPDQRKNVHLIDGEYWYIQPNDGRRRRLPLQDRRNQERMWVGPEYISKSNKFHHPGHYESFTDAAFTKLVKKDKCMEGYVYLMGNPQFSEWYKVGCAIDVLDRVASYQTSSPFRDYVLLRSVKTDDRRLLEREAHGLFEERAIERSGEWFRMEHLDDALEIMDELEELVCT
jgi:hypothetical protein